MAIGILWRHSNAWVQTVAEPDFSLLERLAQKARSGGGRGSGSDDGGMLEQRVARLETDMREVKSILVRMEPVLRSIDERVQRLDKRMDGVERRTDGFDERLRKLEVDVAETKGRVAQLPTAWTYMTTGLGLIVATFGFIFAMLRFALPG